MLTNGQKRAIRKHLMQSGDVQRVTIRRDGAVECYGDRHRGDGGKTPWTWFAGWDNDIMQEIERNTQ